MNLKAILDVILQFRSWAGSWLEPNLIWFQLLGVLLSGLFLWGIIYIITRVNYFDMKVEKYMDLLGMGNLTKRRSLKGWEQIKKRIISEAQQDWKLGVLEADKILDEILKMAGYLGSDLTKKLEILKPENLASLEEIKSAHLLARKIMSDPSLELKKDDAIVALKSYKKAFKELNLLEE